MAIFIKVKPSKGTNSTLINVDNIIYLEDIGDNGYGKKEVNIIFIDKNELLVEDTFQELWDKLPH